MDDFRIWRFILKVHEKKKIDYYVEQLTRFLRLENPKNRDSEISSYFSHSYLHKFARIRMDELIEPVANHLNFLSSKKHTAYLCTEGGHFQSMPLLKLAKARCTKVILKDSRDLISKT